MLEEDPLVLDRVEQMSLEDLAEGKEVEDPIYTGLDVCTQENADSCLQSGS